MHNADSVIKLEAFSEVSDSINVAGKLIMLKVRSASNPARHKLFLSDRLNQSVRSLVKNGQPVAGVAAACANGDVVPMAISSNSRSYAIAEPCGCYCLLAWLH